jgi:hypothetical protein
MPPWKQLIKPEDIDVVAPDGTIRSQVQGYYSGKQFVIDDMSVDIQPGDEIRRLLPNGKEDVFFVEDPKFYRDGPFGSHYQVSVSRRGSFPKHTGGNYNITVSGINSRVNIESTDSSTNISYGASPFEEIRRALKDGIADQTKRLELIALVEQAEKAKNQKGFLAAYQNLIASAANHMTILSPFLPALTQLISQLPT